MTRPPSRTIGDLTFPEVSQHLKDSSILLLPVGAIEQHGPHLPLNTDVVIAEELTRRIIARWGDAFDLWQLPTISISLSREHDWAPGTLCLTLENFIAVVRDLTRELVRSLPARNLVIINGHGGNRGVLENLVRDFAHDAALNACVVHPFDLWSEKGAAPDVHGGKSETSVMMALAPRLVRWDKLARMRLRADKDTIEALVFERGTTWPWRSDDPRLGDQGVIGDARAASAELGRRIVDGMIAQSRHVFERLRHNRPRSVAGRAANVQPPHAIQKAPPRRRRAQPIRTSRRSGSPTPRPPRKKS